MRKGIAEGQGAIRFSIKALEILETKGYKYVQIKGLTTDKYYDYIEPHFLVLVPIKELPSDPNQKDIYEPIRSPILEQWAKETDERIEIVIASTYAIQFD